MIFLLPTALASSWMRTHTVPWRAALLVKVKTILSPAGDLLISFFSGPLCDGLQLASDMFILMSASQTPQALASSMAIHVHHLVQPDFSIWKAECLKYPTYNPRSYCIICYVWNVCPWKIGKQNPGTMYQKWGQRLPFGYTIWLHKGYILPCSNYP